MKLSRIGRILVAMGVVGLLLLPAVAQAHSVTFDTSLSISKSPTGVVDPGTKVTFSGKLSSDHKACQRHSTIRLIKVGVGVVASTKTDRHGHYSISVKVHKTARWRASFPGRQLDTTHPHNHVCRASISRAIRVRVS